MKLKIKISIIFIIFLFSQPLFSQSKFFKDIIQANKYYTQGDYKNAIKYYSKILKKIENGYLYYNIGTCYLKLNKIGKSLFYYEKAKFFIPLNRNLNKNLIIAKSKVKDNFPEKNIYFYMNNFFLIAKLLSLKILFYISIIFLYLTAIMFIYKKFKKKNLPFIISLIIFLIFSSNFIWSYFYENKLKFGYITENNVNVFNDFNENSEKIFTVNDGVKIYMLEKHENFLYVMFQDGEKGWINNKFAIINKNYGQ